MYIYCVYVYCICVCPAVWSEECWTREAIRFCSHTHCGSQERIASCEHMIIIIVMMNMINIMMRMKPKARKDGLL